MIDSTENEIARVSKGGYKPNNQSMNLEKSYRIN